MTVDRIDNNANVQAGGKVKETKSGSVQKKGDESKQVNNTNVSKVATNDTVAISNDAVKTADMVNKVKTMPDVREDKVANVKKQIDDGTYNVEGKKVAEKVVNSAINGTF